MRGDEVRALALRAVDDHDAWCVLEDLMQERDDVRVIVQKMICRAWGRYPWPMIRRLMPRVSLQSMAAILKQKYSMGHIQRLSYADSPLLRVIPKRSFL